MKTTTYSNGPRRAVIVHLDRPGGGFRVNQYGGTRLMHWNETLSWSQAVRAARAWVGAQGRAIS